MTIDRRLFLAGTAALATAPALADDPAPLTIFELRQYTLKGGTRASFTRLFEQQFVTSQNVVGSHVLTVWRDLDDPDRFAWMRGFTGMDARKAALEAFYYGPVWQAHRNAANGMIVDSDNVMLLHALDNGANLRPARLGAEGLTQITIYRLRDVDPAAFAAFFESVMKPRIVKTGAQIVATLATESSANNFPRLPVREHDPVFLWIGHFPNEKAGREFNTLLATEGGWRDGIPDALLPALMQKPEVLRLVPSINLPAA
jgi:hypothetical protein